MHRTAAPVETGRAVGDPRSRGHRAWKLAKLLYFDRESLLDRFRMQSIVPPLRTMYAGGSNFAELLHDGLFWRSRLRMACFAIGSLVIQLPVALGLALLVHGKNRIGLGFFCTAYGSD